MSNVEIVAKQEEGVVEKEVTPGIMISLPHTLETWLTHVLQKL